MMRPAAWYRVSFGFNQLDLGTKCTSGLAGFGAHYQVIDEMPQFLSIDYAGTFCICCHTVAMDTVELIKRSIDLLEDLRDIYNETVAIAILDQQTAVGKIVARVEGKHGVTIRFDIDSVFPAHAGAPAKSIVAFLPEEEREAVLDKMNFERFTEQTICDKAQFEQECEQIRKKGYSVDIAEHNAGCHCVAAPVFDSEQYRVAAVWITSFANRMPVAAFETRSQVIREAAQTISLRIQGKSEDDTAWTDYLVNNATTYFQEHLNETIEWNRKRSCSTLRIPRLRRRQRCRAIGRQNGQ